MKISIYLLALATLIFYSCSTSKSTYKEENIPLENEYAKAKIEKIADLTFENINYEWKNSKQGKEQDSVKPNISSNYPNPFSPSTNFKWFVVEPDSFQISLIDVDGNDVDSLYKGYLSKVQYEMKFTESNLNSGVYFIVMTVGKEKYYRKFIWLK